MPIFVSLFRGINVGGHHIIKMNELKNLCETLGLKDVRTYIQSGNVVFSSDNSDDSDDCDVTHVQQQLTESVAQTFGFPVEIVVRTATELQEIIAKNPFQGQPDKEAHWVVVMFLAAVPGREVQENLLKTYVGPEEIFFSGKEVYIYYTNGIGRSELSNTFIEKKLKIAGTARNWNTILQLQGMILHR